MYQPRLFRWRDLEATNGLLFFAQRVEELLFDYTLDTYKVPSLNTHSRCVELRRTISDVESERIVSSAVPTIVSELAWSVSTDIAARALLGPLARQCEEDGWWRINDLSRLRVQADLVRSHLWRGAYERQLLHEVRTRLADGRKKRDLSALTADLVVEWLMKGFSPQYVYFRTRSFFFSPSGPQITSDDQFESFVGEFQSKRRDYDVVLRFATATDVLTSVVPPKMASLQDAPLVSRTNNAKERAFLQDRQGTLFVSFPKIAAFDPQGAAEIASTRIQQFMDVISMHAHKEQLNRDTDAAALVYDGDRPIVLPETASAVHKEYECAREFVPALFKRTLVSLVSSRMADNSRARFIAAFGLHASAVRSKELSVQLTAMWSALEAIIPITADQTKITVLSEFVVAALCRYYPLRLLNMLSRDLEHSLGSFFSDALAGVSSSVPEHLKCAALVAVDGNESLRDQLYGELSKNPLLKFRLFQLKTVMSSAEEVRRLMENHRQKVEWHLRRVYRARNLLVHAGETLPYLPALVQNLHTYFHRLVEAVEDLCLRGAPPVDLDSALLAVKVEVEQHFDYLQKSGKAEVTNENILEVLGGPMLANAVSIEGRSANELELVCSTLGPKRRPRGRPQTGSKTNAQSLIFSR